MSSDLVPEAAARALAELDAAKVAITHAREAQDVEALADWRDRAAAVQNYASRRDDAQRIAADAGEIKLYAERALGQIDAELRPFRVRADRRPSTNAPDANVDLPDVAEHTRTNWRKLGTVDDDTFAEIVADVRATEPRVTTAAAVRRVPTPKKPTTPPAMESVKAQRKLVAGIVARVRGMGHLEDMVVASFIPATPNDEGEREAWLEELRTARVVLTRVIRALSSDA